MPVEQPHDANWIAALNAKGISAWPDKIIEIVVQHIKFVRIEVTGRGSYSNVDSLVGVIGPINVFYGKIDRILALLVDADNHVTVRLHFFRDVASCDQIAEPVPILFVGDQESGPAQLDLASLRIRSSEEDRQPPCVFACAHRQSRRTDVTLQLGSAVIWAVPPWPFGPRGRLSPRSMHQRKNDVRSLALRSLRVKPKNCWRSLDYDYVGCGVGQPPGRGRRRQSQRPSITEACRRRSPFFGASPARPALQHFQHPDLPSAARYLSTCRRAGSHARTRPRTLRIRLRGFVQGHLRPWGSPR